MTLFQVEDLTSYWLDHPPVHVLVAAYLGVKPRRDRYETAADAPMVPAGFPGLGPARPFSAAFGPNALGDIRALMQQAEAAGVTKATAREA